MISQMKRLVGQVLEGSWAQEFLSPSEPASRHTDVFNQPRSSPSFILVEFLWRVHQLDQSLIQSLGLSSSGRMRGRTESSNLLFMTWFFGDQPLSCSYVGTTKICLIRTKDSPITQETPKNLRARVRKLNQRPNIRAKDAASALTTWEIQGFRSSVLGTRAETN